MAPPPVRISDSDLLTLRAVGILNLSACMAILLNQGKAKANRLLCYTFPRMRTTHESTHESTCRVPYEIVEMIIAHLTHDHCTLQACSLTCRSWHRITVIHLHHTLTLRSDAPTIAGITNPPPTRCKLKPLSGLHELGLVPLVKEIRVIQWRGMNRWFVPQGFSRQNLRYFSAFTNVRTLQLCELDICRFIPGIERYFKHFSPTLQSILLFNPRCTPRQLSHFLSLFSNLDDILISRDYDLSPPTGDFPDTELVPFSAPKLRGCLALYGGWVETWTDLITSCEGLRFRYMDLGNSTSCAPVLLKACAENLETLRFATNDTWLSEWFCMGPSTDLS